MVLTTTEFDTIATISTPPGEGGISIVALVVRTHSMLPKALSWEKPPDKVAINTISMVI